MHAGRLVMVCGAGLSMAAPSKLPPAWRVAQASFDKYQTETDPIQHIDDFRALQLVEGLSALRQGGRQIIVAVEDEALADLLCRRLLSTEREPGRRFTIDYGVRGSADIVARLEVAPIEAAIMREFDAQAAS